VRTLFIAPHADDETLFASYLAQRYAAHIAVVYDEGREAELAQATQWLGCGYTQLRARKVMDAEQVETYMNGAQGLDWDLVIRPAINDDLGHEEHNLVGRISALVFSALEQIAYLTYAPRGQRDRLGSEVFPDLPDHIARKLAALSCYRSQIAEPKTRSWFYNLLDMREWRI